MRALIIAAIAIAIVTACVLYPKECGRAGRVPFTEVYSSCSCAGLLLAGGQDDKSLCYGLPGAGECYVLEYNETNVTAAVPGGGIRDFLKAKAAELNARIVEKVGNNTLRVVWGTVRETVPCPG